jgi:hypothetical protein
MTVWSSSPTGRFDDAADLLAESADEILAFTAFPKGALASVSCAATIRWSD